MKKTTDASGEPKFTGIPYAFSISDKNGTFEFREPYNDEYKEHVLGTLRPFLEQVKDTFHVLFVTVTNNSVCLGYISREEEAHKPAEGEELNPFSREYFEYHICGEHQTGYSSNNGWGSEEREHKAGYIGDNFQKQEGPATTEWELENAFYQWAEKNGAIGDSMTEGQIYVEFTAYHWENMNDYE